MLHVIQLFPLANHRVVADTIFFVRANNNHISYDVISEAEDAIKLHDHNTITGGILDIILCKTLNNLAPARTKKITVREDVKWYNDDVSAAKQKLRQQERLWRKTKLVVHRQIYMEERATMNKVVKDAKVTYYNNLVEESAKDSKKLFGVLNSLLGRSKGYSLPDHSDLTELLIRFSDYFITKVSDIRNSISHVAHPGLANTACQPTTCKLNVFEPATDNEVKKIITSSPQKTCPLDPIPTWLLKACTDSESLLSSITGIINRSLMDGCVPEDFKGALVTPLLKKQTLDCNILNNYRPVSNLKFISKVLEKVVAARLNKYLEENNLREPYQSAYRKCHSTETALLKVQSDILCALGQKKGVLLVLLDLSAAFDTVDHDLLMNTISQLGVGGVAYDWLRAYLTGRRQSISINGKVSEPKELDCGVPQGSVLGPILFTIYTHSLGKLLRQYNINYHFYADDTQLYIVFQPKDEGDIKNTVKHMEDVADVVRSWMSANMLKMNNQKTEVLVIHPARVKPRLHPTINIGQSEITPASSVRNLGVIMDQHAMLDEHIRKICSVAYFHLYSISKIKPFLSKTVLERLVHALITSKLDYCNSLLHGLPATKLDQMQRVQNAAARMITGTKKFDHITPVLKSLHWLPIVQRIKFKVLLLTFKALHGLAPVYLQDLITPYIPTRQLRSSGSNLLTVPPPGSSYQDRAFATAGPRTWNSLPESLRKIDDVNLFKKALKTVLFAEYYS